jgi:hypothetical protein
MKLFYPRFHWSKGILKAPGGKFLANDFFAKHGIKDSIFKWKPDPECLPKTTAIVDNEMCKLLLHTNMELKQAQYFIAEHFSKDRKPTD